MARLPIDSLAFGRASAAASQKYYLRRKGMSLVRLPGKPGSPEFMAAYQAAISVHRAPGRGISQHNILTHHN